MALVGKGDDMIREAYRYRFAQQTDLVDVELILHLAILAAEGLYGETRVRMDAGFAVDESIRAIIIDASSPVGQAVNSMFTHFLILQCGPRSFDVRRAERCR
jgi:hypothetical protein